MFFKKSLSNAQYSLKYKLGENTIMSERLTLISPIMVGSVYVSEYILLWGYILYYSFWSNLKISSSLIHK